MTVHKYWRNIQNVGNRQKRYNAKTEKARINTVTDKIIT
jgi:hypothetical protein